MPLVASQRANWKHRRRGGKMRRPTNMFLYSVLLLSFALETGPSLAQTPAALNSPPIAWRINPSTAEVTITVGESINFIIGAHDDDCNLWGAEWYLDGDYQTTHLDISGCDDTDDWTYTFNNVGNYYVEGIVFDHEYEYSDPVGWTVHVKPRQRGLYVDGFENILGHEDLENLLLTIASENQFDYLALYGLHLVSMGNQLSDFIAKAKNEYQIDEIGAIGENIGFFDDVEEFNQNHAHRFDVLNLEFEYWNDPNRPFDEYLNVLEHMRVIAHNQGLKTEAYLGWPTQPEAQQIGPLVDRVLLHAYVQDPESAYGYTRERLEFFASNQQLVEVWPIFSVEDNFMGPWMENHSFEEAEDIYLNHYYDEQEPWIAYITLGGFQWFKYSLVQTGVGQDNDGHIEVPGTFYLSQNYPNPFNSSTWIVYSLPEAAHVTIAIYSVQGRRIQTLVSEYKDAGQHSVVWNLGENAAGVYFYTIDAGKFKAAKKCLSLK